ncbi:MAG TPA: CHAT domain-containing protein, partial [Chloroflexi bacterium]|nr:CHAT domain-containing protein [Chloroflexota bacterium]
ISLRADPTPYGRRLYEALFPEGGPAAAALAALPLAPDREGTILLVTDHPALAAVPWEYAHDGRRFLALDYYLVRGLPPDRRRAAWREEPLDRCPILFLPSSPLLGPKGEILTPLDVLGEWEGLAEAIGRTDGPYDLIQVRPPTPETLNKRMADVVAGIVHFSGHGGQKDGEAVLLFEHPNGASDPVPADRFARRVRGKALLVFLNACLSAAPGPTEFANLARLLVTEGIPYALGMQFTVPDEAARCFAEGFYTYLARGHTVEESVRRARMDLEDDPFLMGIPVLYTGLDRPHRAFSLAEGRPGIHLPPPPPDRIDLADLPEPEAAFVGRERELVDIGTLLTDDHRPPVVTLHGTGGIGKTALAREAARRFAWAFPEGVLALTMDPLPSLERLLTRLSRFFGVAHDPEESTRRWRNRVVEAMRATRALLVVDNFETVVEARKESREARAIGDLLRRGSGGKTGLLVTGREVTGFPGERVVGLGGLTPGAGARLFAAHVSTRREALEEEGLRELSEQVGGHPLALRLLAGVFDESGQSLDAFRADLLARLPEARDAWTEEARHESLWACFDYSYDALPEDLAALFPRLSLFTAPFPPEIAQAVLGDEEIGEKLHHLWRRGLLDRLILVDPEGQALLYRLHPALHPYAASKAEGDLQDLHPAFGLAYADLAARSYGTIWQHPLLAQVVGLVLPDMVRAAGWVEDEARAALFRFHLGWLLGHYGDLEGAMRLYRQALEIDERLGDQKGKSATLHEMAYIHTVRGDLEGAMRLYQQALEIFERLGDQQGKAMTLGMMAHVLWAMNRRTDAIRSLASGLALLQRLQIEPQTQQAMAADLARWRQELGPERFDALWEEAIGQPLPPWLAGPQALSLLALVEQAARQGGEAAQQVWQVADQMAADPQAPP